MLFERLDDQDIPGDFSQAHAAQCVHRTRTLSEVVVFDEKLQEGTQGLDVSSSNGK